jgi:hypothetical protein
VVRDRKAPGKVDLLNCNIKRHGEKVFCFKIMKVFQHFCILFISLLTFVNCDEDVPLEDPIERPKASEKEESSGNKDVPTTTSPGQETEEENQYKLGSLCNYCSYCKVRTATNYYFNSDPRF